MKQKTNSLTLFVQKFLDKYYRFYKYEQIGYVSAFLASQRQQYQTYLEDPINKINIFPDKKEQEIINDQIYDQLNTLEIDEHWEISKSDHLQQLFRKIIKYESFLELLNNHKLTLRNEAQVINKRYEELSLIRDIIDPNKFPIFSMIDKISNYELESVYNFRPELKQSLSDKMTFSLTIDESNLDHHSAGNGLFINIDNKINQLPPGTLIGLLPGIVYDPQESFQQLLEQQPNYTQYQGYSIRYDDTIIDFTQKLPYPMLANSLLHNQQLNKNSNNSSQLIDPSWLSPYGLGHMINHPAPDQEPNVILLDINIPQHFFTNDYLMHLPIMKYSESKKDSDIRVVGVFSLDILTDGCELLMDYNENNMNIPCFGQIAPEWLQKCPKVKEYMVKYEYESDYSMLLKGIQYLFMTDDLKTYRDQHPQKRQKMTSNHFNNKIDQ